MVKGDSFQMLGIVGRETSWQHCLPRSLNNLILDSSKRYGRINVKPLNYLLFIKLTNIPPESVKM
jgi:hypothetical protein